MAVETLSSNVVNYIVWRYLQEAGYAASAHHLAKSWIPDPESLPFARNVAPHTLINLLQDGLWLDKLQAEATNGQRRYRFGANHGRPFSDRNGDLLTLDEGIPAYQLAEEAGSVPEPPPKKKGGKKKAAKTNGVVAPIAPPEAQVNGDAMDIDQNGHTQVTNSVRAESEVIASDAESPSVADLPISTLTIGQSTELQTEKPKDLAPSTIFSCSVSEPYKKVTQTLWGTPDAPVLMTVGTSILRSHVLPKSSLSGPTTPRSHDLKFPLTNYSITALCWNSSGEATVSARQELTNETGEVMKKDTLYRLTDGGDDYRVISSNAGLVTTLRWNEAKHYLLAISSDGRKGSIKIWNEAEEVSLYTPTWATFTPTTIFDAAWTGDSSFVVCGDGIFEIHEITESLTCTRKLDTNLTWENVKYDARSGIIAALGTEKETNYLGIVHPNNPTVLQLHEYPDQYFSDLDFRPQPKSDALGITSAPTPSDSSTPVLLATCSGSGIARVWDANQPFKCLKQLPILDESMANSIAFSPNGRYLAAAGPDEITIWELDRRDEPLAVWRARDVGKEDWDPFVDGDFSLGWDPDSSRLSIALGNQIAVVTM